jgi:hypothetical protein
MVKTENTKQYTLENMDEHFLVIIDNMVSCRRFVTIHPLHSKERRAGSGALQWTGESGAVSMLEYRMGEVRQHGGNSRSWSFRRR